MSLILQQPFSEKERLDFIVEYNHKKGLKVIPSNGNLYALEQNEIFINGKIEINPFFEKEKRLYQIEIELIEIQQKLKELDLKTIRALREGGANSDGVSYLEVYQSQINELRQEYSDLISEKATLETNGGTNDITN